jgi:hypothetical protein
MEQKVDIFLIFLLNVLQVQKAISYHLMQAAGISLAFFCPSFPEENRIMASGVC